MTELKNINVKENTVGSQVTTKDSPIIQTNKEVVFEAKNFNLWYGDNHALQDINLTFHENDINAIIGPSGCGKSTFVKSMNRMTELVPIVRTEGSIDFRGDDIFTSGMSVEELRTRV